MITIEQQAIKIMNDDAAKAFPDECCGFMFGQEDAAGNRVVTQALPIDNSIRRWRTGKEDLRLHLKII
jgi:proteasome lid subunit RPN8/RPN11